MSQSGLSNLSLDIAKQYCTSYNNICATVPSVGFRGTSCYSGYDTLHASKVPENDKLPLGTTFKSCPFH